MRTKRIKKVFRDYMFTTIAIILDVFYLNDIPPITYSNIDAIQKKWHLIGGIIAAIILMIVLFYERYKAISEEEKIREFDTFKRLNQFPQGDYSINGELTIFEPHWRILIYEKYSIKEINWLIKQGVLHESEVLIPIEGKKNDYTKYKRIL